MQAEDRLIHFSTELMHPPKKPDTQALQKLYYELSQQRSLGYDSIDIGGPQPPKFYSRRGEKAQSVALFMPDRLVLIEEWADIPLAQFLDKVRGVSEQACACLSIPHFLAQTITLRSTFALSHCDDARVFLLERVCNQADRIGPYFQRPINTGGLRFVLPETPDHRGTYHVIIESFRLSNKEVFVEVRGVFANAPIQPNQLEIAEERIREVRSFIQNNIYAYLNQYDNPVTDAPDF